MRKTTVRTTIAAVAAVLFLALAGCSSGPQEGTDAKDGASPSGPPGTVFDFTQINGIEPAHTIIFTFPDELVKLAKADGKAPLIKSVTVTGRQLDGSLCAADVKYALVDGALDRLKDTTESDDLYEDKSPEEIVAIRLASVDGDTSTIEELDETEPGAYVDGSDPTVMTFINDCASSAIDDDRNLLLKFPHEGTYEGYPIQLAEARITLMKNGTIGVAESEVEGYQLDANGEWIA